MDIIKDDNTLEKLLFDVYEKGVIGEDCDLTSYINKIKQALNIHLVVVNEVELCDVCDCDRTETMTICKECYLKDAEH